MNPSNVQATEAPVRVVAFDWGGVILRICRGWSEGCAAAGIEARADVMTPESIAKRRPVHALYQEGRIACGEFCERLSVAMEGLYSPGEIRRIHDAWLLQEYPGVAELVATLCEDAGIETALLSNTNHAHWRRQSADCGLPHFPTAGTLKHKLASHIEGCAKPGEAFYRALEARTGAKGAEIVFFDDLPENIDTARRLGWRAEKIDHSGDTAAQMRGRLVHHGVMEGRSCRVEGDV